MDTADKDRLRELIAVELQVGVEAIRKGVSLRKDLGMDSVAALNILFAAEEVFGIRVPERELESVDDLDAICDLIRQHHR